MARSDDEKDTVVVKEMRRQLASEPMKRFVRSLPGFALDRETPRKIRDLLDQLDQTERLASSASRRQ